jgi:hypothetical protein
MASKLSIGYIQVNESKFDATLKRTLSANPLTKAVINAKIKVAKPVCGLVLPFHQIFCLKLKPIPRRVLMKFPTRGASERI